MKRRSLIYDLQFTLRVTVFSSLTPSPRARFQTTHRYSVPSSSRTGVMERMAEVGFRREPPLFTIDSNGSVSPFRYHRIKGSGLPPLLEQLRSRTLPSVAVGSLGTTFGSPGGRRTVNMTILEWSSAPEPLALIRHSNFPLSRSYVAL